MKKLMYILFFLMSVFNLAAQNNYVIDSVCVGVSRSYQIIGEKGSTYEWYVYDTLGNVVLKPIHTDFWVEKNLGDTTWSSKIKVPWNDTGEFDIMTLHFSEHGCDTLEQGRIKVFPDPEGDAGKDMIVCKTDPVLLASATASGYSSLLWTTIGDGAFDNDSKLNPVYTPGIGDIIAGSATLVLQVNGLAQNVTCIPVIDTLKILFGNPLIKLNQHNLLCFNDSSGSIKVVVTGGIGPFVFNWTGPGTFTADSDSIFGLATGKYKVSITDNIGCVIKDSAEITQPDKLIAGITEDKNVICFGDSIIPTGKQSGGTLNYTTLWSGNGAAYLSAGNIAAPTFKNAPAGLYELIYNVTDTNGCFAADTLLITVNPVYNNTIPLTICENDLPYDWRGQKISKAGFYIDSLLSINGCDSVFTLDFNIWPVTRDTIPLTVCENELPYNWRGKLVNKVGFFSDTLSNIHGCDSIDVLVLNTWPVTSDTIFTAVCENDLPYIWQGKSLDKAGFYSDSLFSIHGCDSVLNIQFKVKPAAHDTLRMTICENELPYNWRGLELNTPGIYSDSLVAINGCDSVLFLDFEVLPVITDTLSLTICNSQLPYSWLGHAFTTGDTILITVPSVTAGCDTLRILELQSVPEIMVSLDTTICENDLPFTWHGEVFAEADTITQKITSATTKCDTIRTLQLKVNPLLTDTLQLTVCENELPYIWHGDIFNTADTIVQNIVSVTNGCDTIRVLQLQVNPLFTDTLQQTICSVDLPFNWHGNEYFTTNVYRDTLSGVTGCDTILALDLIVEPDLPVSVTVAADKTEVDEGESVAFTATPANEGTVPVYAWFVNDREIMGEISATYNYIPQNGDVVYAVLTSDLVCTLGNPATSNKISVKVNVILPVSVTIASEQVNICQGNSVTFTATPVNEGLNPVYAWFVNAVVVQGATSVTFTYLPQNGDVVYAVLTSSLTNVTGNPAKSNEITITIKKDFHVIVNIFADKTEICDGETVTFNAQPVNGGTNPVYAWFVNNIEITGEASVKFTCSPKNSDLVYARLTSNLACAFGNPAISNKIPIKVNDNATVSVTISADKTDICEDEPVTFTALPANGGPNPLYAWFVNGKEITGETSAAFSYVPNDNDAVYAVLTSDLMCTTDDKSFSNKITVDVKKGLPVSVSVATDKTEICEGDLVTYTATPENGGTNPEYKWYVNGTAVPGGTSAIFTFSPKKGDEVYAKLVSDVECPLGNQAISNKISVAVSDTIPVNVTIAHDKNFICVDDAITFTATPVNGGINPVYSWFVNNIQVLGITTGIYSYQPKDGDVVHVVLTSDQVCIISNPAVSNKVTVSIISELPVSVSILPDKNVVCEGDTVIYTATPVNGGKNPVYEWFVNKVEFTGATKQSFSYSPKKGDEVYVVLTSDIGCVSGNPATSDKVVISIDDKALVSVSISANKTQICLGETVNFTALPVNGGVNPVYTWFVNGKKINGEKGETYAYKPENKDEIVVKLTSGELCVIDPDAISDTISINITDRLTVDVVIAADKTTICDGDSVTFIATPVNGGDNPAFAWFVNGTETKGKTGSTFIYKPKNSDQIYVRLISGEFCAVDPVALSNKITIAVSDNMEVSVTIPEQVLICENSPVTITAKPVNGGANPVFKWFVNKVEIAGENSASLIYIPKNKDKVFVVIEPDLICVSQKTDTSNAIVLNVGDIIPPEAICRDITIYLDKDGKASIASAQIDNGSKDNCKPDTILLSRYDFDCADVGKNMVTLTAIDAVGLRDSCEAAITVIDNVKPVVSCKEPFEIQLDENAKYNLAVSEILKDVSDACGIDNMYIYPFELECDNIGLTTITLWAIGVNGDSAYCESQVTIYGNRAPNVLDDSASTFENIPVIIEAISNDYDEKTSIDISSLAISIKPLYGTVTINRSNGELTYTPNLNFSGVDVLQYRICDDGIPCKPECGTAFVYINVLSVNEPPVTSDDFYDTGCLSISKNVLENDIDPDGSDNMQINTVPVTPPRHGTVSIDADGTINYFPNQGFIGKDSLEYVVCDNGIPSLCDTVKVYINVDCNELNPNPLDCELFIPEGFSPDNDGILDFFRIWCIEHYPDAKLMIFNRNGNLLYQKEHYGNYNVWGDKYNAWWWGTSVYGKYDIGNQMINGEPKLKVGNYVYVLQLGNGMVKNGTVLVIY